MSESTNGGDVFFGMVLSAILCVLLFQCSPIEAIDTVSSWDCTKSKVINHSLPKEEECTQYTKADKTPKP